MKTIAHQYADACLNGDIPVGRLTLMAMERFQRDIADPQYYFDQDAYNFWVSWFDKILFKDQEWNGKPIALHPWQHFFLANVFAIKRASDGKRKYTHTYLEVARKNGKTTLAAGLGLGHVGFDPGVTDPWVIVGANDEKQAKICTNAATKMITEQPLLRKRFKIYKRLGDTFKINNETKPGVMEAVTGEASSKDGSNPSFGLIDEFHEAKRPDLYNVIQSGQGQRPEPLMMVITTAGFNKLGPCYSLLRATCIEVLKGIKNDPTQFALIYTPDPDDDWTTENTWRKANPMYDHSESIREYMHRNHQKALNEGGATEVNFKTKNLNIWTDSSMAWIPDHMITASSAYDAHDPLVPVAVYDKLKGMEAYAGLDLAQKGDFNSLVLFFPTIGAVLPFFWATKSVIDKNDQFKQWRDAGFIRVGSGDIDTVIDFNVIWSDIDQIYQDFYIKVTGFDKYISSHGLLQKMLGEGIPMEIFAQNYQNFSFPMRQLEVYVRQQALEHYQNPVLRWMFGNVEVRLDPNGNIKPDRAKSVNKIDGVVALIMAVAEAITPDEAEFYGIA